MKKLNRNHFKGLQSQFPVLSKEELEAIMGGDDCFFHCMHYFYDDISVNKWEKYFKNYIGKDGMTPDKNAIYTQYIGTFLSKMGFSYANGASLTSTQLRTKNCIMIYAPNGTTMGHAVIPKNFTDDGYINCLDPENQRVIKVHPNEISEFYIIDK